MEEEVNIPGSGLGSALPWYWIIETLASSHLHHFTPLLFELVSKAPPSKSDSAKKATEALALRCLDELSKGGTSSCDGAIPQGSSKGFDFAESCDDVLQRVLDENSVLDLHKDISDEFKRDIRSFVEHKKAGMSRSTLESLKNAIAGGRNPLATSLKEISRVGLRNNLSDVPYGGPGPTTSQIPSTNSLHSNKNATTFCDDRFDRNNHEIPFKKRKLDYPVEEKNSLPFGSNGQQSNVEHDREHQSPKANGTLGQEFHLENISLEKMNVDDDLNQPHTLPFNNVLPREIDLQTKVSLLSSRCSFGEDSLSLADSQINLCMKCEEGGELLICSSSSCPLAFHEGCLGCSTNFDAQGNFYCPFCVYSRAIREYVRAKKNASLARRELSCFISGRTDSNKAKKNDEVDQHVQDEVVGKTGDPSCLS